MKSMKKLVLAGLVLLASVVVLVGCKMEAEGQQGQQGPQGQKVYKFTSEPRILSDYKSPNNTDSKWTYVAFGDWPQTIKDKDVDVDETKSRQMGMFTYYLGSDGNYYVEAEEKANGAGDEYKYSDGTQAGQGGSDTEWFKVEPIVWRVLTEDYTVPGENGESQSTGKVLLLAENILTAGIHYHSVRTPRTIEGVEIFSNNYEHSQIRAFLNGLSYAYSEWDSSELIQKTEYEGKGFLQTAFTENAQREIIVDTKVDNSARSTNPESNDKQWNYGNNAHASETKTKDKIFLLSEQEATMSDYGFAGYDVYVGDDIRTQTSTRI